MRPYAATTTVPVDRSQAEVRAILNANGCTKFALLDDGPRTIVQAVLEKKGAKVMVRFILPFPDRKTMGDDRWMQECRRRWRCLVVMLKAKFASVESGIVSFQEEFLSNLVLPGGKTVGEWAEVELAPAMQAGRMPSSLLLGSGAR